MQTDDNSKKNKQFEQEKPSIAQLIVTFTIALTCMVSMLVFTSQMAKADEGNLGFLSKLNLNYKVQSRLPGNYIPSEEVISAPEAKGSWAENILAEDNRGVLRSMKKEIAKWESEQEYARNWHLEDTGLYNSLTDDEKKRFISRRSLKYLDKRITGEIKQADEGSKLHTLGQVQSALKPTSKIDISKSLRFRFKAQVLQGSASVRVENPYVETTANFDIGGEKRVVVSRQIAAVDVRTWVDYDVTDSTYIAVIRKRLNKRWSTQISSEQSANQSAFTSGSNRILRFNYKRPF